MYIYMSISVRNTVTTTSFPTFLMHSFVTKHVHNLDGNHVLIITIKGDIHNRYHGTKAIK